MSESRERLAEARKLAGFDEAKLAADAMGIPRSTYFAHENGSRPMTRAAARYARFFRVSLDWLTYGRGTMRQSGAAIPLVGSVGAGGQVGLVEGDALAVEEIMLPDTGTLNALMVRGDSQYPRYQDGEIIIFSAKWRHPHEMIGDYAVVHTSDGRRMVKIVRAGRDARHWRLDSHNAPPEDDVLIDKVYPIEITLPSRKSRKIIKA